MARLTPDCSTWRLPIARVDGYASYRAHLQQSRARIAEIVETERQLVPPPGSVVSLPGCCWVCRQPAEFRVDFNYAYPVDGVLTPNWRERLVCAGCGLINRVRATIHVLEQELAPRPDARIYISEQQAPMYGWLLTRYPNLTGSEFLGKDVAPGTINEQGIRHEDLTNLSFATGELDFVLSFDVLEHMRSYPEALMECYRCLRPGGVLFISVPFRKNLEHDLVRAYVAADGSIVHRLPPEYHYDPIRPEGCLCFRHFGWELLDRLREVGFERIQGLLYWSRELGYMGGEQLLLTACRRPRAMASFGPQAGSMASSHRY